MSVSQTSASKRSAKLSLDSMASISAWRSSGSGRSLVAAVGIDGRTTSPQQGRQQQERVRRRLVMIPCLSPLPPRLIDQAIHDRPPPPVLVAAVAAVLVLDLPVSRPFSPTTTRCGMPISSMSANMTPGRASRSSSKHIESGRPQLVVERLGRLAHALRLFAVHGQQGDLERRDRRRPDDAALVVVLLDGGGHDAGDADAVAAHGHGGVSRPCSSSTVAFMAWLYLLPSWKIWPTSMPRAIASRASAVGAGVAVDHVAQVRRHGLRQVAAPVDAGQVLSRPGWRRRRNRRVAAAA